MTNPPPNDIRALAQAGAEALRAGDARKARLNFERVVASGGADAAIWLGLAIACGALKDDRAKIEALDKALGLDPQNLRALIIKADHLAEAGDARAACAFYTTALKVAPPAGQLPPDAQNGIRRAQAMVDRFAVQYEAHLRNRLAARGFDVKKSSNRFAQSLDILTGKKRIYFQEPRHYFFPELPQVQYYDRADFPWLDWVEAATDDIRSELLDVMRDEAAFEPYVQARPNRPMPVQDYAGMLNNPNWSAFFLWKDGVIVRENALRCPRTLEALADAPLCRIPGRTPSVLFSLLRPGARIPPHHGMINTRLICHLPLIVPPGCGLRVGNDTREWEVGKAWVFDDTIEHEAWNRSDQTRVILLFDIWRPELSAQERDFVAAMFVAVDEFGGARADWEI